MVKEQRFPHPAIKKIFLIAYEIVFLSKSKNDQHVINPRTLPFDSKVLCTVTKRLYSQTINAMHYISNHESQFQILPNKIMVAKT